MIGIQFMNKMAKLKGYISIVTALFCVCVIAQDQEEIHLEVNVMEELNSLSYVDDIATAARINQRYSADELRNPLQFDIFKENNEYAELFKIDEESGVLRTNKKIDREEFCAYQTSCLLPLEVPVYIIRGETKDLKEVIKVTVVVDDMNDNAPKFLNNQETKSVYENMEVSQEVAVPAADDKDSPNFGIERYEIVTGPEEFELRQKLNNDGSIDIYLTLVKALDREQTALYRIVIAAFDGGNPSQTGTLTLDLSIIDVNDNYPIFENTTYSKSIREDFRSGNVVLRVRANDPDEGENGEIVYGFNSKTVQSYGELFSIDSTTGDIRLQGELDYETRQIYTLTVTAKEANLDTVRSEARVTIHVLDVNDQPPRITVNSLTEGGYAEIKESATIGQFVARIAVDDAENGQPNCELQNAQGAFALQSWFDDYKLVTSAFVDREATAEYNLIIKCVDSGVPALTATSEVMVKIADENDSVPKFSKQSYSVVIAENNEIGQFLVNAKATDADEGLNGQVTYVLTNEATRYINIDQSSGNVTAKVSFDYEDIQDLSLTVIAADNGSPSQSSTAIINILITDVNDRAPEFTLPSYTFGVVENGAIGEDVDQVFAFDKDQSPFNKFTFAIHESTSDVSKGAFTIESNTGKILTTSKLDREITSGYSLTVLAIDTNDSTLSSTALVYIYVEDINDNYPQIYYPTPQNNTVYITKQLQVGDSVTRIIANDSDSKENGTLRYYIETGNDQGVFLIDTLSGQLSISTEAPSTEDKTFKLDVLVKDMGIPPKSNITVLNIYLNQSISSIGRLNQPLIPGQNLTILISVAVISGALIIILIIAIVLVLRRKGNKQRQKNFLIKLFTNQKQLSSDKNNQLVGDNARNDSMESIDKTKKEVSFSNDVEVNDEYPSHFDSIYGVKQKPQQNLDIESMYSKPIKKPSLKSNNENGYAEYKGSSSRPYHHEEPDTFDSENLSNSDSGHGSHEDVDLSSHPSNSTESDPPPLYPRTSSGISQAQGAHAQTSSKARQKSNPADFKRHLGSVLYPQKPGNGSANNRVNRQSDNRANRGVYSSHNAANNSLGYSDSHRNMAGASASGGASQWNNSKGSTGGQKLTDDVFYLSPSNV